MNFYQKAQRMPDPTQSNKAESAGQIGEDLAAEIHFWSDFLGPILKIIFWQKTFSAEMSSERMARETFDKFQLAAANLRLLVTLIMPKM